MGFVLMSNFSETKRLRVCAHVLIGVLCSCTPQDAEVQAALNVFFERDGRVVDQLPRISLIRNSTGIFSQESALDVPDGSDIRMSLVLNIISNPSEGRIALETGPFELQNLQNCNAAEFKLLNEDTNSVGTLLTYSRESTVQFYLRNVNCGTIDVQRNSIIVKHNGVEVRQIIHNAEAVTKGVEVLWVWDQSDELGNAVQNGMYTIEIQTSEGIYSARVILVN